MSLSSFDWLIVVVSIGVSFLPAILLARRAGSQHGGVLHLGPRGALVADRRVDGGDHLQHRHAEPGHQLGARAAASPTTGSGGRSCSPGMATVFFYARLWRRSGVLTDLEFYETALQRPAGLAGPRLPRRLPRPLLQLRHHGLGEPRRGQDRQRDPRLADGQDAGDLRGDQHRLCGHLGALGRPGDRLHPVRHRHDRVVRRGVLRAQAARGRRPARALLPSSTPTP